MNVDSFVAPSSSISSPTGFSPLMSEDPSSQHAVASAIPIRNAKEEQEDSPMGIVMPASFPHHPHVGTQTSEFGYVQRRVRKTSVDERIVCFSFYFFHFFFVRFTAMSTLRFID